MLIFSFLISTGEQNPEQWHFSFNSLAEEQNSMKEAIVYVCNNKSNKKPVKEQFLHGQNCFSPATM